MSVINQMLKDLEQRRSSGFGGKGSILDDLASDNGQAKHHWGWKLIIILLVTTVILLAWLLWDRFSQTPTQLKSVAMSVPATSIIKNKTVEPAINKVAPEPVKIISKVTVPDIEIAQATDVKETNTSVSEAVSEEQYISERFAIQMKESLQKISDKEDTVKTFTTINRISPERVLATGKRSVVRVYGQGFIAPFEVLLEWSDGRAFKILDERQVELISEHELHLHFNPGTQTDEWAIRVERRGGKSSERFAFNVYASATKKEKIEPSEVIIKQQKPPSSKTLRQAEPAEKAANLFSTVSDLLQNRRPDEARTVLHEVLSIDAQHSRARELLASLLFQDKQHIEAATVLEAGISQQPSYIPFRVLLARVRMEQGRDTDAIIVLEGQKPQARDYSDYYALLAALYQRSARYNDAANIYRGLVDVYPGRAVWWMGLGISMQSLDKSAEALVAYQRALKSKGLQPELKKFVQQRIRLLGG